MRHVRMTDYLVTAVVEFLDLPLNHAVSSGKDRTLNSTGFRLPPAAASADTAAPKNACVLPLKSPSSHIQPLHSATCEII